MRGLKRTNLVFVRDSGIAKVQFRVQCEIWLTPEDAATVEDAVMPGSGRTEEAMRRAERLVVENIAEGATAEFHQIVSLGFKDQRNPEPKP
jgi:hypothetical protein